MKKLNKKDLEALLQEIAENRRVYAPVSWKQKVRFEKFSGQKIEKEYLNALITAKKILLPDQEKLLSYKEIEDRIEIQENQNKEEQFIFGIRPCDLNAVLILDKIESEEYEDKYYQQKRKNTIFAVLECNQPGENCFCAYFGAGPWLEKDADLIFTDLGEQYLVRAGSDKGQEILENPLFKKAKKQHREQRKEIIQKAEEKFKDIELDGSCLQVDEELIEEAGKRCISCYSCTFLCPVCSCFDVIDKMDIFKKTGERHRCWDSCMAQCFSEMAGGVNPRSEKEKRLANKIKDKLQYMPSRIGEYGCVGCGRCIDECPAGISIKYFIENG